MYLIISYNNSDTRNARCRNDKQVIISYLGHSKFFVILSHAVAVVTLSIVGERNESQN